MRVNPNNPINLFAASPASKAASAKPATHTAARPELGFTKPTNQVPTSRPVKLDLSTLVSDSGSTTAADETTTVDPEKKFQFPEGATLLGLMSEWGSGASKYDFTQDGQVNVEDMLVMIHNWQESFGDELTLPPTDPSGDPVDVDAIVPAPLPPISSTETESPTTVPPSSNDPADSVPVVSETTELTSSLWPLPTPTAPAPFDPNIPNEPGTGATPSLNGLLGAWGQDNTKYDFNADGTVNVDDLLLMIQNWPGPAGVPPEFVTETFENAEPARRNVQSASAHGKLQELAEQISTRLTAEGFGDQPPVNIRELVAQLNLSPKQTDFMMKQMQAKYPQGLGVSMVA